MRHVPNTITIIRMFLVPLFIYVFFSDNQYARIYALAIYLIAGLTDLLDGYLARKYNVVTVVGIVLDPLADKLMLLAALWCLAKVGVIPFVIFGVIVVVEGVQIATGMYMYFFRPENPVILANKFGKSATVLFALAVSLLLLLPHSMLTIVIVLLAVAAKGVSFASYFMIFLGKNNK